MGEMAKAWKTLSAGVFADARNLICMVGRYSAVVVSSKQQERGIQGPQTLRNVGQIPIGHHVQRAGNVGLSGK